MKQSNLTKEFSLPNSLAIFIFLGTIFGLQIIMLIPLSIGMATTFFSITFRAILMAFSLYLILRGSVSVEKTVFHIGFASLVVFYTIYLVRLIFDLSVRDIAISPSLKSDFFLYSFAIGGIFLPILASIHLNNQINIKRINNALFYFSLIQSLSIAFIFFILYGVTLEAIASRHIIAQSMAESDIGQPINPIIISKAGGYLALISVFFKPQTRILKLLKYGAMLLGFLLLLLGASRGPLVALIMSYLLMLINFLFYNRKNRRWRKQFVIGVLMIFVSSYFFYSSFKKLEVSLFDRLTINSKDFNKSLKEEERFTLWSNAFNQFKSSPVFGDRIVEKGSLYYPHNLFLEVLMSTGLIGFTPFFLSVVFAFKRGWSILVNGYPSIFFLFFFSFIGMFFSGSIFLSPEFWVTILIVFTVNIKYL